MLRARPRPVRVLRLSDEERVLVRPVRSRDAAVLQAYVRALSPNSRYNRFFGPVPELPPAELDRVLHLDGRSQLALIAQTCGNGASTAVAEARYALTSDGLVCEFALSVADDFRHKGLGMQLLAEIECRARVLGARRLVGDVLRSNETMHAFARKAGYTMTAVPDPRREGLGDLFGYEAMRGTGSMRASDCGVMARFATSRSSDARGCRARLSGLVIGMSSRITLALCARSTRSTDDVEKSYSPLNQL
jgi:GNAT superfamily N-acetyltransferase